MPRPDFPRTIVEFQRRFPDDDACMEYLFASRWPEGFACPRCGHGQAWPVAKRRLVWECAACRRQTSVTAGTVLHKLRRAMVNPERQHLLDEVEVDECFVGGHEAGLRGGRARGTKVLVAVGVEVRGAGSGRARMAVIDDASAAALTGFVRDNVAAGATVHTDAWRGYRTLTGLGYDHRPRSQRAARAGGEDVDEILPRVHRVISNLKSWLQGTHRGVSGEHLQVYLDEYTFRLTAATPRWPPSRPCSACSPSSSPRPTGRSSRPDRAQPNSPDLTG